MGGKVPSVASPGRGLEEPAAEEEKAFPGISAVGGNDLLQAL